jgi:hypothetical protein
MEAMPVPVDVSRLKNILGGAKLLMNKVESGDYETGHVDPRGLTEDGVKELQSEGVVRPQQIHQQASSSSVGYTEDMVRNSKLPEAIKQAMISRPIQQMNGLNHTFNLEDVSELSEGKPMGLPKVRQTAKVPQRVNETKYQSNDDMLTISREDLDAMIDVRLLEFFTKTYNKMIIEDTIKKTMGMLIKEGKITVKKKIS